MHITRRRILTLSAAPCAAPLLAWAAIAPGRVHAQSAPREVASVLAPSGTLRVAINYGNPVLAQRHPASSVPRGLSVDLANEIGRRLGLPIQFVTYDAAGRVTDARREGAWDLCFLAVDPVRAQGIRFTAPYVVIEGTYLVAEASPLRRIEEVDRPGTRISVARGSAYDLFLSRELRQAQIVRVGTSPEAVEVFRRDALEAAAGVKQPLIDYAAANPGFRVIPGRFMVIEQAIGIPQEREAALPWLRAFVEEMKASGVVARGLEATGQRSATVAPSAP
ncbi:ABC transporter substrate-binding protein [Sabulicella glaciei]|uniref:ABC transporter substrate-binding protein n=1 Tax=Sabulicella glaciei TaxID=2984948 RepID=A0ABT3NPX3_9PROT|nr:ABC transporter substrate-binding protein [Roseococcus sp. MDT2-1-1]MCW8084205.1 ABC transporter substrate-binding protein [Roseococcus sp. MDT2-1-1]